MGEYYNALMFDEDILSMDRSAIIQLKGAASASASAAAARALDAVTFLSIDNRSALGKRINAVCQSKCRISGAIEQIERNSWYFKSVTEVESLDDDYDFASASQRVGGPVKRNPIASNGEPPRDIGMGDPLRKPLLDALRPSIETDLEQAVQFKVATLRKQNEWAFIVAEPLTRLGGKIDFAKTRYAEAIREGIFDGGTIFALLRHDGKAWAVSAFVIGPTDVTYAGWPDEYGAPYPLFGLEAP